MAITPKPVPPVVTVAPDEGTLARHAARRFGTLPEIAEGLLLHLGEQLLVGNLREFVARVQPRPDPDHLAGQDRLPGSRFQAAVDDQPVGSIRVQPGGGFERDALRTVVNVAGVHLRASGVEQIDILASTVAASSAAVKSSTISASGDTSSKSDRPLCPPIVTELNAS